MNSLAITTAQKLSHNVATFVNKNATQILAGVGIGCGIASVGFAIKGTIKAVDIVKNLEKEKEGTLTKKEIVKATWKEYVPVVGLGALGIGCVVGSVNVSMKRLATMTAAYAMSEKSFKEYKDKAIDLIGEKKEEEIRGAIAQDYISENPPSNAIASQGTGGGTLCLDSFSGQYFWSDADIIRRTANELNNELLHDFQICLNDYYVRLGLNEVKDGNDLGWNIVNGDLIGIEFTTELGPGNQPVLVVDFTTNPFPNYRDYL